LITNPTIENMLNRKSIRSYTDREPTQEELVTILRAGQQAPFASQLGSVLLKRDRENNPFHAPLYFTICVDAHKWELIMAKRNWQMVSSDLLVMLLGMQDAALMAENMVIAAESFGMGSCFLGAIPYHAEKIVEEYRLPPRIFPMVGLAMGFPAESPPPRPRYPLDYVLFEDEYPTFSEAQIEEAMQVMDEGYLSQKYYQKLKAKIRIRDKSRKDTFDYHTYSWTEHICRKWGQDLFPPNLIEQFEKCGFYIDQRTEETEA
jgi:nitroreductase